MIDKLFKFTVMRFVNIIESFQYDDFIDIIFKAFFGFLLLLLFGVIIGAIGAGITGEMSVSDVATICFWLISPVLFLLAYVFSSVSVRHIYRMFAMRFRGLKETYPNLFYFQEGDEMRRLDGTYAFRYIGVTDDYTAVVKRNDSWNEYGGGYKENLQEISIHRLMLFYENASLLSRRPYGPSPKELRAKVERSYNNQKIKSFLEVEEMIADGRLLDFEDEDSGIYPSEVNGKSRLRTRL